jgi:hypothetical protein
VNWSGSRIHKESFDLDKTLKETFSRIKEELPDDGVTLSIVLELLGKKSHFMLSGFLALPFLVPVSIPGSSTILGAIILLIGIGLVLDRPPKLPERLMTHTFPTDKFRTCVSHGSIWIHRLEKISYRRFSTLCEGSLIRKVNGLVFVLSSLLLMAPLAFIPFSNTFPGLAILMLSIGILQHDGIMILLGYLFLIVTLFYFAVIAFMGVSAATIDFHSLLKWLC